MRDTIDVYWSFRSPYSYLVTPDLLRLRQDYEVDVKLRPVLPIALRASDTVFNASDKKKPRYIVMDSKRRAEYLGMPFHWPDPDPVAQDTNTFEVAKEQPLIWRLTGLGIEAERAGKGIDFAHAVATLLWGGTRHWDTGEHLHRASESVGIDLASLESALEPGTVKIEVERNHAALEAAGHWGVPTMVARDEPFFGQDRIDTLRWRLDQYGLRK